MQKVFIIFLLSLSSCLSKPSELKDVPANHTIPKVEVPVPVSSTTKVESPVADPTVKPHSPNVTDITSLPDKVNQTVPTNVQTNATKIDGDNKTSDKKEEVSPKSDVKKEESPKTDVKKEESPKVDVIPAATEQSQKTEAIPQEAKTKVEPIPTKNDVTPKPNATVTSTVPPKADGEKPVLQARGFDGPSFIGGIILTLGLLAIGFMGFKYYKNQTERNYHTL